MKELDLSILDMRPNWKDQIIREMEEASDVREMRRSC